MLKLYSFTIENEQGQAWTRNVLAFSSDEAENYLYDKAEVKIRVQSRNGAFDCHCIDKKVIDAILKQNS